MPELPEVETTRLGISPFLMNQTVHSIIVRHNKLRIPIPPNLSQFCENKTICTLSRRGKYLIIHFNNGALLIHLGMSGCLKIVDKKTALKKHDHIDLCLKNGLILRYHDPRRFGLWQYLDDDPAHHMLLAHLGPEPLTDEFNGDFLYRRSRKKKQIVKSFIMNNKVVVGVGNIYAAESLFLAGIHPKKIAENLTKIECCHLSHAIKNTLNKAIEAGGTTLRDFFNVDGSPGYFAMTLKAYGRQGLPCYQCQTIILACIVGGRKTTWCPKCQPL